MERRKACFLFKQQKKRTCCEANTGFWLDAPLPMVRERRRASNPVPATSQKPGQTPGLFNAIENVFALLLDHFSPGHTIAIVDRHEIMTRSKSAHIDDLIQ